MNDKLSKFKKIKYLPLLARICFVVLVLTGGYLSFIYKNPIAVILLSLIAIIIFLLMAFSYRCPYCKAFLWNARDKSKLQECPLCRGKLK